MPQRSIYLDNAASTPIRAEVVEAMMPFLGGDHFGNPSSVHAFGRAARAGLDGAKREVAEALDVDPHHVVFTSGGTEADNLAVVGAALAARAAGRPFRIAVGATEHKAVLATQEGVLGLGGEAECLPVDVRGQLDRTALDAALGRGLAVVSAMWVNNETGIVQDVAALAHRCAAAGVPFHTDAVQAVGKIPLDLPGFPWTMLSISGHKIGAPKGIGALLVRDRATVDAIHYGGGQQYGLRPGTENVAFAVGLAAAIRGAVQETEATARHVSRLRDTFEANLTAAVPTAVVVGRDAPRAPHIACVAFPHVDAAALVMHLDLAGLACSGGSACNAGSSGPSHAVSALGTPAAVAGSALRFSFHTQNTPEDVEHAVALLPGIVNKVSALTSALA